MNIEQVAKLPMTEMHNHLETLSYIELSQLRHEAYRGNYRNVCQAIKFIMNTPVSNAQLVRLFDMRNTKPLTSECRVK